MLLILFISSLSIVHGQLGGPCATDADCMPATLQCIGRMCEPRPGAGGVGDPCRAIDDCQPNMLCTVGNQCILNPFRTTTTTPAPTTTTAAPSCPNGWTRFSNTCLFAAHGSFNFQQASSFCTLLGGALATLPNFETDAFASSFFQSSGRSPFWIGLRKVGNQWFWPNNQVAVFTNWRPGQPDGCCGANVTCALADFSNISGQWDDSGCGLARFGGQNFGFMCETGLR